MKKLLSITLTFLLAIVITYAGSGINAYSFCCEDCHSFGVEAITDKKCCDIHNEECHSNQDVSDNGICDSTHQQCTLDRLDIDLQETTNKNSQTQISIKQLDVYFTTLLNPTNSIEQNKTPVGDISQTQKPPNLSRQVYFALLETLII